MKLKSAIIVAAVASVFSVSANAETVATTDGTLTVIESTAPLGAALRYSSGGAGLIGLANNWPNVGSDTTGVNAYDHYWQSFNPAIVWTSGTALSQVFAIPGVDHDPFPYENLEFIIFGSNDGTNWEEGKIAAIYRDGFDTANTFVGHSDDYTSLWTFSKGPYTQFMAAAGNHLNFPADIEGEIDSLAAPIPEPETYAMFMAGLGLMGFIARRRKNGQA